jgi:arginase family enzyme
LIEKIHISFDIHALDPIYYDPTISIYDNGLHIEEVGSIIKWCIENNLLGSMDIVEINPLQWNNEIFERTINKLILNIFE